MEDSRRLASLQKRRELKAAGIESKLNGLKKRYELPSLIDFPHLFIFESLNIRKYIDYAREIPFQKVRNLSLLYTYNASFILTVESKSTRVNSYLRFFFAVHTVCAYRFSPIKFVGRFRQLDSTLPWMRTWTQRSRSWILPYMEWSYLRWRADMSKRYVFLRSLFS